jgi:hypothetical protein
MFASWALPPDPPSFRVLTLGGASCAVTATGIRCRNKARPGSAYCGIHEKEAEG